MTGLVLAVALAGCTPSTGAQNGAASGLTQKNGVPAAGMLLSSGDLVRLLTEQDRALLIEAQTEALDTGAAGAARAWSNAANGHGGTITPGASYSVNQYSCRDFTQTLAIDGRTEQARGTACRHPDGSWRAIS